jgi:hypothetical protein
MKNLVVILSVLVLSACSDDKPILKSANIVDQCLRNKLFEQCLKVVPAGPLATKYNDWDEVISTCGGEAYRQSLRYRSFVKPECMAD